MQFAINWSPEAAELLNAGTIQVDLFKCPDWDDLVADAQAQLPSYVHFPLTIGAGQHETWDVTHIHDWLSKTDTRFVNCHIVPNESHFSPDISLDELTAGLIEEIQPLVDEFGRERVIIENCPYFAGNIDRGFLVQAIEPALFHGIIEATGCGFLFDVSHAVLTSEILERDFETYINALPVEHIREMHITGMGQWSTGIYGDHLPMTESDWTTLDTVVEQLHTDDWRVPDVMAFEYGGIGELRDLCGSDKAKIAEQVPRLYDIANSIN